MFEKVSHATLTIEGMSCGHCQKRVTDALTGVKGVKKADVNLESKSADVMFYESKTNLEQLKTAVEAAGYTVSDMHIN